MSKRSSLDWRPYTEHAPADVPLWLETESGAISAGKWSDKGGFKGPHLPLGELVVRWAAQAITWGGKNGRPMED